jgi:DNA (cytosine-5)-methyltransferase 1
MRYLSVCSGIEAATVAWHGLGWQPVGFSEIEKFPSQVLAHHYPSVPNVGDMTKYKEWDIGAIDLLVGGTPCQSFSVAGLRKGLADPRGNLALVYLGIADLFKPKWIVWENVPGVLSSNGGRDFGSFLGALAELGYGFAYRVLDAQWFGVAQRRRRVFVVGYLGDWRPAAAVLFEPESLRRDTAPSREKGQAIAPTVVSGPPFSRTGNERVECEAIVPVSDPAYCLETTCNDYSRADGFNMLAQPISIHPHCIGRSPEAGPQGKEYLLDGSAYCMDSRGQPQAVAQPVNIYGGNKRPDRPEGGFYVRMDEATSKTLDAASGLNPTCSQGGTAVMQLMAVRRLTPVECERLQGFPDNYTAIPWRGKTETPDGPRYKALGNSMAVPVMRWIGERIQRR